MKMYQQQNKLKLSQNAKEYYVAHKSELAEGIRRYHEGERRKKIEYVKQNSPEIKVRVLG